MPPHELLSPSAPPAAPADETTLDAPALGTPASLRPPGPGLAPGSTPPSRSVPPDRSAPPGRSRLARAARWAAGAALLGVLVWVGITWVLPRRGGGDVLTATATRGALPIVVSDKGELESSESVMGRCEVEGGGKLVSILPEGTQVKKGDSVAKFDTDVLQKGINEQEVKWETAEGKLKAAASELEVQKNKAEGEIAKAKLTLTLAKLDQEAYEKGEFLALLDSKKSTLELGKKDLKEAQDGLEFSRGMVKKGFYQQEQLRAKELFVEGKQAAVRQAETDLRVLQEFTKRKQEVKLKAESEDAERNLQRTIKSQDAASEKAENEVKAAKKTAEIEKKQLERLKAQLDQCEVKAPGDGILIYVKFRPWDDSSTIKPGAQLYFQQPIFNLPDLTRMKVKMKVHESVVKKVKVGLPVTMKIDALPNQVLHGKVISVATLAQSDNWRGGGVKEYETYVSIDDLPADAGLRPGMSAEVKILVKTIPEALTVPVQAVTEVGGQHVCYVVSGDKVERREVTIGDANDQLVQVLEGISEGDRVALDARSRAAAELGNTPDADKKKDEKGKAAPAANTKQQ
ncbi:MAG: efflux RND transporter periplasmic adaptor subunit [Gemmataceae bacterium]|nr:efflux RND transporter periplasmic adaptor subunit [Gemmataceae bacterium]